ncbi:protein of unknown function (plasmid) [Pararobbsia alpina]
MSVFSDTTVDLDPRLPQSVVRRDDLRQYLRTAFRTHEETKAHPVLVDLAYQAVFRNAITDPKARKAHVTRIQRSGQASFV